MFKLKFLMSECMVANFHNQFDTSVLLTHVIRVSILEFRQNKQSQSKNKLQI